MPLAAIVIGVLLAAVGLGGWMLTEMRSWTALIPAILGGFLILLGVVSRWKPNLRKHLMHAAMGVALLGLLGSGRMLAAGAGSGFSVRMGANAATAALSAVFLALGLRSFIEARRKPTRT